MSHRTQPPPREHHFYVAIAKFLFHHAEHGIVCVRDPIKLKDAECYGLEPLMLYGLTVAGLPIRWMTFTPLDKPRPFLDVLLEAWRNATGLRGHPDILRINRHLAAAAPELAEAMAKIGVRLEVADAKEKSLPASMRSAQDSSRWLLRKRAGTEQCPTESIQALCRGAQSKHEFLAGDSHAGVTSRATKDGIKQWLALPVKEPVPIASGGTDWQPGPWLYSWEDSVPPDQPRYFNRDWLDGSLWLLTGEQPAEELDQNDDDLWADYDNAPEIAKHLVACWPNPPAAIAKSLGITLRELQWFTSGKAPLDQHVRFDLEELLGIEYDEHTGGFVAAGPYVLVAHKPKDIQEAYESISGGGDARPCEIVPSQGAADPSWRYYFMNVYDEPQSIVMAPRGEKITECLPDLLLNYEGIRSVSPDFYRDVVSTCARASREPGANVREMKEFATRAEEYWIMWAKLIRN